MGTWTKQKGYPILTLIKSNVGKEYLISQERFFTDRSLNNTLDIDSPYNYRWEVPVTFVTSQSPNKKKQVYKFGFLIEFYVSR